jgi:hypothetical protein
MSKESRSFAAEEISMYNMERQGSKAYPYETLLVMGVQQVLDYCSTFKDCERRLDLTILKHFQQRHLGKGMRVRSSRSLHWWLHTSAKVKGQADWDSNMLTVSLTRGATKLPNKLLQKSLEQSIYCLA